MRVVPTGGSMSTFSANDLDGIMIQLCGGLELFLYRGRQLTEVAAIIQELPDGTFCGAVSTRSRLLRETRERSPGTSDEMESQLREQHSGCLPVFTVGPTGRGLTWLDVTSPINGAGGNA